MKKWLFILGSFLLGISVVISSVQAQSLGYTTTTLQSAAIATGNGTAATTLGYATVSVDIVSTATSYTLIPEVLFVAGGTYRTATCYDLTGASATSYSNGGSTNFRCNIVGAVNFRARISAITAGAGSVTVVGRSVSGGNVLPTGGGGVTPTTCTNQFIQSIAANGVGTCDSVVLTTDVSGILPTANGGTGIAFFTAAGPTTARVYTFPDASTTILTTNAAVTFAQGGTGLITALDDTTLISSGSAWVATVIGNCVGASDALTYAVATNAFGCNTISAGANALGTYLVQTATNAPANAQIMGALGTGLVINTTTTGVQSIYGGAAGCTNQFVTALSAVGASTCTTVTLASAQFANQGTTTTVLHGNGAGNPSFSAVSLTADITGTLAFGNGGTGLAAAVDDTTLISSGSAWVATAIPNCTDT